MPIRPDAEPSAAQPAATRPGGTTSRTIQRISSIGLTVGCALARGAGESEQHARRLRELTTQQQKLVQLYYRDAVSEDVLKAEQARITAERAQVEHWANAARHQIDDVMTALDEALALVDAGQRAYDLASESQRRLLNLAIFEHFTIHEESEDVIVEPQLEEFYDQLIDFVAVLPGSGNGRPNGQRQPANGPTAALTPATGGNANGRRRNANPSPVSWGQSSHSERMAEREGFEPSVDRKAHTRFPVVPVQPLRHLSKAAQGSERPRRPTSSGRCRGRQICQAPPCSTGTRSPPAVTPVTATSGAPIMKSM